MGEEEESGANGPIGYDEPIELLFFAKYILNQVQVVRAMRSVESIVSARGISTLGPREVTLGTHTDNCTGHATYCARTAFGNIGGPIEPLWKVSSTRSGSDEGNR